VERASRPTRAQGRALASAAAPNGRAGVSGGSSRERILRATAWAVRERGYRHTTVSDIVAAAGVSRRLFYERFTCKQDAFIAAYEHAFERTLAACTPAFFSSEEWTQKIWQSALAASRFLAAEPLLAHLGFVEGYAPGRAFAARAHATQLAFTLFLEEGYRETTRASALPRSCLDLTAAAIMELGSHASRGRQPLDIRALHPLAVYIALAPFITPDTAGPLIASKLLDASTCTPRPPGATVAR
jgi:AcrR family transcriptional regulator